MANELDILYFDSGTPYARIRRVEDLYVWDGSAFVVWSDADVADYAVSLTDGGGGYYATDMPTGIAAGFYSIQYFEQTGVAPLTTDAQLAAEQFYWNGTAAVDSPPAGDVTVWGTRAGTEQKGGVRNLKNYVFLGDTNEDPDAVPEPSSIAPAIADDLIEAATDMAVAWREFTATALGYSNAVESRWLADTNEYGALVKAWAGRNIERAQTDDVPQQIATALAEWERRLQMLRDGTALQDYQDANAVEEEADEPGTFQTVPMVFEPTCTTDENAA